jgi:pyruvate carboxylase
MTTNQVVAATILQQLGGANKLVAMIGAHSFIAGERSLSFQIKARATGGIKGVRIVLTDADLYSVTFVTRGGRMASAADDVYADQLRAVIEQRTGLYLSLGTMRA